MSLHISHSYKIPTHSAQKILSLFLLVSTIFLPFSYTYAALSCSVTTSAACTGTIVLRMSGTTNAHAELPSQSTLTYENAVVCCTSPSSIGNSCSGNFKTIGRLSSVTNAHIQESSINTYGSTACISDASVGDTVTIGYQNSDCSGYDTTLLSLSGSTNATVGDATAYNRKVCGTIASTITPPPPPPDGGGGGASGVLTGVLFSGIAYPGALVHIWKDGSPRTTILSDDNGFFNVKLDESYTPSVLYTLYAVDKADRKSLLVNYPVVIRNGSFTRVSNIRFAPTIAINKSQIKVNTSLSVSGYAAPNESLSISVEGMTTKTFSVVSNTDGTYQSDISLDTLPKGDYTISIQYENDTKISTVLQFTIAETSVDTTDLPTALPADCNADNVINLTDFSVMAFWYGKSNPPKCVDTNHDNVINLTDFSILAYYWTQ